MTQEIDPPRLRAHARRFLRRFRHTTYSADDLYQDCWVAYLKGTGHYHRRMVDAMRLWHEAPGWRGGKRFRNCFSLAHVPANYARCTTERDLAREERAELVRQAVDRLPDWERLVVMLTWWEGKSAVDIARIIGRTDCRVSQIKKAAAGRLRKALPRL